jgi:hypothetical protein
MNRWLHPDAFDEWLFEERAKNAILVLTSQAAIAESGVALLHLQARPCVAEIVREIRWRLTEIREFRTTRPKTEDSGL